MNHVALPLAASTSAPLSWSSASHTHRGTVRKVNEDAVLARPEIGLWAVADGMGGHETGDVASQMIVQSFYGLHKAERLSEFVDEVEDSLLDVNRRILQHAELMLEGRVIGSTVVTLLISGRAGVCLWAGDSRLYLLRHGQLQQLSRDHSQVEEMVQRGELLPEQAEQHVDANVITRAVGAMPELYVDATLFSVMPEDTFLLCSDGLYKAVELEEIKRLLALGDAERSVSELIETALENGASDNVSVVVVRCNANK